MVSRENNFDLLRLFAAFQVLLGHAFFHLKIEGYSILMDVKNYFPGVLIFFTISGFLITFSFDRNRNLKSYFTNRFLRIYPALWCCLIITILLLFSFGVLSATNFYSKDIVTWVFAQITFGQFYTPDILRIWGVGCPNGSLWTIPVELQFYIVLPIIVLIMMRVKLIYKLLVLGILSILFNMLLDGEKGTLLEKLLQCSCLPYLYCFFIGSILYINWDKLEKWIKGKFLIWLFVFVLFCILMDVKPSYHPDSSLSFVANVLLGILTISAAFTYPGLGKMLKGYDISYGMYIYHMLVINCLVQLGFIHDICYFGVTLLVTLILSMLSWVFIERKALALKARLKK